MAQQKLVYSSNAGFSFRHVKTTIFEIKESSPNISHSHPQYEIYYLISGEVYYHVGGATYHIKKGDVLLLNSFVSHSLEILPSEDYERYVVEFEIANIPTIKGITPIAVFFNSNSPITFLPKTIVDKSTIVESFKNIENECLNHTKYTNHHVLSHIIELVTKISEKIEESEGVNAISTSSFKHTDIYINKITQYISANVSNKITIDDIANNVHLSRSYLQHLFKDIIGTSISNYILQQKMHAANFMIVNGKSLQEAASLLGYTYYSTFCMHYKKVFGKSPKKQIR